MSALPGSRGSVSASVRRFATLYGLRSVPRAWRYTPVWIDLVPIMRQSRYQQKYPRYLENARYQLTIRCYLYNILQFLPFFCLTFIFRMTIFNRFSCSRTGILFKSTFSRKLYKIRFQWTICTVIGYSYSIAHFLVGSQKSDW